MKTESIQEFLARGGKVTICPQGSAVKKRYARKAKADKVAEPINYELVPANLKIALGIK